MAKLYRITNRNAAKKDTCSRRTWKGSITVEASLVVPIVLACIFLLIIMNYYLHDMVVLNSFATEAVYAEQEQLGELQSEMNTKTFVLHNTQLSEEKGLIYKKISWKNSYTLPAENFFSLVLNDTTVDLGGKSEKQHWSKVSIIRIKTALVGGSDSW